MHAQGRSFACLPLLQELRIWASTETDTDMYDGAIEVDLAGLPASLQTVSVTTSYHLLPSYHLQPRTLPQTCPDT